MTHTLGRVVTDGRTVTRTSGVDLPPDGEQPVPGAFQAPLWLQGGTFMLSRAGSESAMVELAILLNTRLQVLMAPKPHVHTSFTLL